MADRREDIEPNIAYELERISDEIGTHVTFNAEEKAAFMDFAMGHPWCGNFRELKAILTRMAPLASAGRIDIATVRVELERQRHVTNITSGDDRGMECLLGENYESRYDLFDVMQLSDVVEVCRGCTSLSEVGCKLFAVF